MYYYGILFVAFTLPETPMFAFAILIGIYSYLLFFLGLFHVLYKPLIILVTVLFWLPSIWFFRKNFKKIPQLRYNPLTIVCLILIGVLAMVNLIGALAPELAFDALWYHLTFAKIYLMSHSIDYIPGGLLYYSVMPKLGELLYTSALAFKDEIFAKLLHYFFGILTTIVVYKVARRYLNAKLSVLASLIFYSNLVVAWESTTAYIDLIRTFFEVTAFWSLLLFIDKNKRKYLLYSATILGFAICTKLLSLGSLFLFIFILIYFREDVSHSLTKRASLAVTFVMITLCTALPWFIFAFLYTSNPVYPFFTSTYAVPFNWQLLNPLILAKEMIGILLFADDPVSPIYLIIVPLVYLTYKQFRKQEKLLVLYSLIALFIWYFTPRTGGGRFILPYLPVFSVVAAVTVQYIRQSHLKNFIIGIIILISCTSIVYRAIANKRYLPVVLGFESKQHFLSNNLNFAFGDFYDTDGVLKKTIKTKDTVLIIGGHNLYYVDFPFIHYSWLQKNDRFNYILTQDAILPRQFSSWHLIYKNEKTHVKLYKR